MTVEAHASVLAGWFYCARKCIYQLDGIWPQRKHESIPYGARIHDWLAKRPLNPTEQVVANQLERFKIKAKTRSGSFFHRTYEDFEVFGDIDSFNLRRVGFQIVEFKTIGDERRLENAWYICPAAFQVRIYAWLLEPVLEELHRPLADNHMILYYTRRGMPVEGPNQQIEVDYDPAQFERDLKLIHTAYHDRSKIIYPKITWKCLHDDPAYVSKCEYGQNAVKAQSCPG